MIQNFQCKRISAETFHVTAKKTCEHWFKLTWVVLDSRFLLWKYYYAGIEI